MNGAGKSVPADEAVESGFAMQKILHIYQFQKELFLLRFQPVGELFMNLANVAIEVLEELRLWFELLLQGSHVVIHLCRLLCQQTQIPYLAVKV